MAESPLQFFHLIERLKNIPRRGWGKRGIPDSESDGDHMYRMAMMVLVLKVRVWRTSLLWSFNIS